MRRLVNPSHGHKKQATGPKSVTAMASHAHHTVHTREVAKLTCSSPNRPAKIVKQNSASVASCGMA